MWTTSSPTRIKGALGCYPSAHRWVSSTSTEDDFDNIVLNKWCHVVYSYAGNGIEATLFLNGEDKTDYDNPDNDNTADIYDANNVALTIVYDTDNLLSLGLDSYDDSAWESYCEIGFARVYNVALTPAEVRKNFAATRGGFGL